MKNLLILTTLSLLLLIWGCNNSIPEKETFKEIKDEQGIFSITVPYNWQEMKGVLNDAAEIEAGNAKKELYFIALMEHKDDIAATFTEYNDLIKSSILETYGVESTSTPVTLEGYKANIFDFDATVETTNIHMWYYTIETENYYGQLLTWTLKSKRLAAEPLLKDVASSFKELNAATK